MSLRNPSNSLDSSDASSSSMGPSGMVTNHCGPRGLGFCIPWTLFVITQRRTVFSDTFKYLAASTNVTSMS